MEYPDFFLRGIARDDPQFINPPILNSTQRIPTANLFTGGFDLNEDRQDEFEELSINWIDDDGAYDVAFSQINSKNGGHQFKAGVGVYDFATLKEIASSQFYKDILANNSLENYYEDLFRDMKEICRLIFLQNKM